MGLKAVVVEGVYKSKDMVPIYPQPNLKVGLDKQLNEIALK